jgi:group I intron endonuclease
LNISFVYSFLGHWCSNNNILYFGVDNINVLKIKPHIIVKTNMGFIYAISNTKTNKIYIGKTERTVDLRWKGHISESKQNIKNQSWYLNNSIRKYGTDSFELHEIISCSNDLLNQWEEFYIEHFNTIAPNGYNLTKGGEGCKPTEETRIKMSLWQKGKPKSQKHRESMSQYAKNRPESHRNNIAEANRNRIHNVSDVTKLKMSKARRKLTDQDLVSIRELQETKPQIEVAKMYGISTAHARRIKKGWQPKK